ncbi:MAG: C25 family cysteine peptidase [Bacteroidetes bacterium]|nr:C25 family cysteine peptidase [Bacteroidota bacterium]
MKHLRFIFICVLCFISIFTKAQNKTITYSENHTKQGFTLIDSKVNKIEINYAVSDFNLTENPTSKLKKQYHVNLPKVFLFNEAGMPDLACESKYIAIPNASRAVLHVKNMVYSIIKPIEIAPAPVIPTDIDKNPMVYKKNDEVYQKNEFYPAQPVIISKESKIRGADVVMLSVTPFQYNPVTKELRVIKNMEISIEYEGGSGTFSDNRLRSRWWEPILEDALFNYNDLPQIDFSSTQTTNNTEVTGCEYLIITPTAPEFRQWADSLKKFRNEQGISTIVKTISEIGGNTAAAIENYVNNAYNNWTIPPSAILLLGDYGTDSTNSIVSNVLNDHPAGYNPYVSDNPFADVTGDNVPDIAFARITARNATELQIMIKKNLNYERTPPTDSNFYKHPISALGWQTERWFQLCSEVISGYWKNALGKVPVRINAVYSGNPTTDPWSSATNTSTVVSYFGPTGLGYIAATPQTIGGFSGGTAAQINTAINNGSFILQHRDHGMVTGWGEPSYTNTNISSLTNTDLCFIMSVNCQTGKFDDATECFAEKFHRYAPLGIGKGALGLIAATEVSYSFVNDVYIWGAYDNMWPNFMPSNTSNPLPRDIRPCFGNAAGKHFLQSSSWPYNSTDKNITYNLFHHHGDAFLWLYSEVPQYLAVTHSSTINTGVTSFSVTANSGSLICISYNGQILGTGIGTGSPVSITIPGSQIAPQLLKVVVTKQNYYRYESNIQVLAQTAPFIIYNNHVVNDTTYANGNGEIEYNEDVLLSLTLKNIGLTAASNVSAKIKSSNPYITLLDSTELYGTINPGINSYIHNGYRCKISDSVPDNSQIAVNLIATDGTNSWNSNFTLTAFAPNFNLQTLKIDDAGGNNNGILDPGETANILLPSINTGHSKSINTIGHLSFATGTTNPYLTINNPTSTTAVVIAGDTLYPAFSVTANASTAPGTLVNLHFAVNCGANNQYHFISDQPLTIGYLPVYCAAGSTATTYEYISNVAFGSINQASGRGTGGYQDFTAQIANLTIGTSTNATITVGSPYTGDQILIWIDWNHDADFTDAGEQVYISSGTFTSPHTTSGITVPGNALLGSTRMRIRLHDLNTGPNSTPCGNSSWGEVEDYTVNVIPACSAPANQATSFTSSLVTNNTMSIGWTRGNGDAVLVVANQGSAVNANPVNGINYSANASFGSGTQIGTGNFVVYNGTGNAVNLTSLSAGIPYYFSIYEYNTIGNCYKNPPLTASITTTNVGIEENTDNPLNLKVFPNPFNDKTTISYTLMKAENVELTLVDITGKEVIKLVNEKQDKGNHQLILSAANYNSGIYFYKIKVNDVIKVGKLFINN